MKRLFYLILLLAAGTIAAQQSASFELTENSFNSGGASGTEPASASFRLSLVAIGDSVVSSGSASSSFTSDGGFVAAFRPPAEVKGVAFAAQTLLEWDADLSALGYALYGGQVTDPFDPGFGTCQQPPASLTAPAATLSELPSPGQTRFYLITARNRLGEEGTKGSGTSNSRPNPSPCP